MFVEIEQDKGVDSGDLLCLSSNTQEITNLLVSKKYTLFESMVIIDEVKSFVYDLIMKPTKSMQVVSRNTLI